MLPFRKSNPRRQLVSSALCDFEHLEPRKMMTVSMGFDPLHGLLVVTGDAAKDIITISRSKAGSILLNGSAASTATVFNTSQITIQAGDGNDNVTIDLGLGQFAPGLGAETSGLSEIEFVVDGQSGNDRLTILGHNSNADSIFAGVKGINLNNDDDADVTLLNIKTLVLNGRGGNDTLSASGGSAATGGPLDFIDIRLLGGNGDDLLTGGAGPTLLDGGDGNDNLRGIGNGSVLEGRAGNDFLVMLGAGDMIANGGEGGDRIQSINNNNGVSSRRIINGEGGFDVFDLLYSSNSIGRTLIGQTDAATGEIVLNLNPDQIENRIQSIDLAFITQFTSSTAFASTPESIDLSAIGLAELQAVGLGGFVIRISTPIDGSIVSGSQGDDTIRGANGADQLFGNGGNDTLQGFFGDDFLSGGPGNDLLEGGIGNDDLVGGSGNDVLKGEDGFDRLAGNSGNDSISGGPANDTMFGGTGNDVITGGSGNDLMFGGDGDDRMFGETGDDRLFGENGNDTLDGGPGNNFLDEGPGQGGAVVYGTTGHDVILIGRQVIDGQPHMVTTINGVRSAQPYANGETIIVYAQAGNDVVVMEPSAWNNWRAIFHGQGGDDHLFGGQLDDQLFGEGGNDWLYGLGGNDALIGGGGQDRLFGQLGSDLLIGGAGVDWLYGESDDDILIGGSTVYDQDEQVLAQIVSAWTAPLAYEARVHALTGGGNSKLRAGKTVLDDGTRDWLFGSIGRDLFHGGWSDWIGDRWADEVVV